jgi:hypothetical protein
MSTGELLYKTYKSVFSSPFPISWEIIDETSQKQWNDLANKFLSKISIEREEDATKKST